MEITNNFMLFIHSLDYYENVEHNSYHHKRIFERFVHKKGVKKRNNTNNVTKNNQNDL